MANVLQVLPKGDKGAAIMHLDDGTQVWTPEIAKAQPLIGSPIPADWTLKEGQYGPQAFAPRPGGAGGAKAAWRNTKEGAEFEAENWRRKQAIEQDHMDRRTALMQTVALVIAQAPSGGNWRRADLTIADDLYAWLRKEPTPTAGKDRPPAADKRTREKPGPEGNGAAAGTEAGVQSSIPGSGGDCAHASNSGLKPNGDPLPNGFIRCEACGYTRKGADE